MPTIPKCSWQGASRLDIKSCPCPWRSHSAGGTLPHETLFQTERGGSSQVSPGDTLAVATEMPDLPPNGIEENVDVGLVIAKTNEVLARHDGAVGDVWAPSIVVRVSEEYLLQEVDQTRISVDAGERS